MLSLSSISASQYQNQQSAIGIKQQSPVSQSRFLVPIKSCINQLSMLIKNLKKDPWPVESDKRPLRSTGCALSVAVSLLEVVASCLTYSLLCLLLGREFYFSREAHAPLVPVLLLEWS